VISIGIFTPTILAQTLGHTPGLPCIQPRKNCWTGWSVRLRGCRARRDDAE